MINTYVSHQASGGETTKILKLSGKFVLDRSLHSLMSATVNALLAFYYWTQSLSKT